ncbi:MAG: metallophosphoesterase [Clostridia bacterium]|nr:metallophosphoesterase [Clostridia bacterium]
MTKQQKTNFYTAVASAFCRTVSKKEQLRREARLREQIHSPFRPVFRFAVVTDIHIHEDDPINVERLKAMFQTAYDYAAADKAHPTLDAVLFTGDNTDNGKQVQYDILNAALAESLQLQTTLITVMGNHDHGNTGTDGYRKNLDDRLDKHVVVDGYHFIGMAPLPNDTWHTPRQLFWMAKELRRAAKDDPKKPIFTFQHGHIWKTVYVSRSWYTQMSALLHLVYARYPQVVNFSGHSHGPVNHPLTVWQSRYTAFGAGTLNYFEMERDIGDETVPPGSRNAAQYLIVELDAKNRIRVQPYNLLTNDFFRDPADPEKQLIYFVENPRDRKTFAYTGARKKTDCPPQFPADAMASVSGVTDTAATVTFGQAKSTVCVYGYRLQLFAADALNKPAAQKELYSEYYFEPMPETLSHTFEGLHPGTDYTVRVLPLNVWRKAGNPLIAAFKTK